MVIVPSQWLKGALIKRELTELKKRSIDLQIKSTHSGYRDPYD